MKDASKKKKIFISHTSSDKNRIWPIVEQLKASGISFWLDVLEMRPGTQLFRTISEAISDVDFLVVMISKSSVKSKWVNEEVKQALSQEFYAKKVKVIPCLLEKCELPDFLRDRIYCDFTSSISQGISDLLRGIYPNHHILHCTVDSENPFLLAKNPILTELNNTLRLYKGHTSYLVTFDFASHINNLQKTIDKNSKQTALFFQNDERGDVLLAKQQRLYEGIPFVFSNLSFALNRVLDVVLKYKGRRLGLGNIVFEHLQRSTSLVLGELWDGINDLTFPGTLEEIESLSGFKIIEEIKKIKAISKINYMDQQKLIAYIYKCKVEDLLYIGMQGKKPIGDVKLYVPSLAFPSDTMRYLGSYPLPPDGEIPFDSWLKYFVPGIVYDHVYSCSNTGQYLADYADNFSVRIQDFQHFGYE